MLSNGCENTSRNLVVSLAIARWNIRTGSLTLGGIGDPKKVTASGESAGAMSISTHMVLNNGDVSKKFRGAWIFSGPVPRMHDYRTAQPIFDRLMARIGCGKATDKIACARKAPYNAIYAAVQSETNFLSYTATLVPWYPRPDGKYLVDDPATLVARGKVANIPFTISNMVDEGTLFSLVNQLNVTTEEDFIDYFKNVYWPQTPRPLIQKLAALYPTDPTQGSPFGTGQLNQLGPMYKRLAALIGDYTFVAGRRKLLDVTSTRQKTWSAQIKDTLPLHGQAGLLNGLRATDLPILGSFDISDVVFYAFAEIPALLSMNTLNIMSSLLASANNLDPKTHGLDLPHWPNYDSKDRQQFQFKEDGRRIIGDAYRKEAMAFINDNAASLRA